MKTKSTWKTQQRCIKQRHRSAFKDANSHLMGLTFQYVFFLLDLGHGTSLLQKTVTVETNVVAIHTSFK